MKIKVFCPNTNGKLEFTKEELEKILNDAYNDGYRDGTYYYSRPSWTYTSPYITCSNATRVDNNSDTIRAYSVSTTTGSTEGTLNASSISNDATATQLGFDLKNLMSE